VASAGLSRWSARGTPRCSLSFVHVIGSLGRMRNQPVVHLGYRAYANVISVHHPHSGNSRTQQYDKSGLFSDKSGPSCCLPRHGHPRVVRVPYLRMPRWPSRYGDGPRTPRSGSKQDDDNRCNSKGRVSHENIDTGRRRINSALPARRRTALGGSRADRAGVTGRCIPRECAGRDLPVVPSASAPQRIDNQLGTVSCVSATACTAVGYYVANSGNGPQNTFIESWNGTRWAIVPSPNPYT
jgi:hypothetical protein